MVLCRTTIGAALGLNANILPVFEQLGLLDELQKIAFPCINLELLHEDLSSIGSIDISGFKEKYVSLRDQSQHLAGLI